MSEAPRRHYCTYFDRNYLVRALALHQSLRVHGEPFTLWALCLDEETYTVLTALEVPEIVPISLSDLEAANPELRRAQTDRSRVEYIFTLSPFLPLHVISRDAAIPAVTYLDADLFFFSSPEPIFDEIGDAGVAVIEHRFPPRLKTLERFGRFNVGWITFRRSLPGLECLTWWRARCLEWCYDRVEKDRFADQKYLDAWPDLLGDDLHVIKHRGANVAPWSLGNHEVMVGDSDILIGGQPLVFFHFQGLRHLRPWLIDPNVASFGTAITRVARRRIFRPYVAALREEHRRLQESSPLDVQSPRAPTFDGWRAWPQMLRQLSRGELLITPR